MCYTIFTAGESPGEFIGLEVERMELQGMTSAELNQYLENIAKLIEATGKDPETTEIAAKIVRDSKVKA